MQQVMNKKLIFAWLFGIPLSYVMLGFLGGFYPSNIEIALLTLLLHPCVTLFVYYLLGKAGLAFQLRLWDAGISIALFAALTIFIPAMVIMAWQFPSLFDHLLYQLEAEQSIIFVGILVAAFPLSAYILPIMRDGKFTRIRLYEFINKNLGGLLLFLFFFLIYLLFASIFNQPTFNSDDIFFDADSRLWRWRFATEDTRDYYWRSVHPFVLIIIRPLVALIGFLLKGDRLYATFVLVALTGALCVFLVWYFIKNVVGNSVYALLIATLFGASSAQLVFGALIETYIFLVAAALIFLVLLLKDKPMPALVIAGLIAFGITISNFGQTVIAHLLVKRDFKQWVKYGVIVAALVIPLTLLNNFVYPDSQPYFFDIATYDGEGHNSFPPTVQRANYLGRVMFLHSIVAPQPLILDEEIPFLKVWMFRASIKKDPMRLAEYENGLSTSTALIWFMLMLLGGVLFLKNFQKQDNRFFFTFILLLLFYFALHLQYGKDVFLYSVNWTYAVILFLALAWKELAHKKWFQITLLMFIGLLLINNSQLIHTMLSTSALRIK